MPKFKKGDICKTMHGKIAIVERYCEDNDCDFVKVILPDDKKNEHFTAEDYLEPLQGSELEKFLKEYPQYRKEGINSQASVIEQPKLFNARYCISDGRSYLSMPPKSKCSICGSMWTEGQSAPICSGVSNVSNGQPQYRKGEMSLCEISERAFKELEEDENKDFLDEYKCRHGEFETACQKCHECKHNIYPSHLITKSDGEKLITKKHPSTAEEANCDPTDIMNVKAGDTVWYKKIDKVSKVEGNMVFFENRNDCVNIDRMADMGYHIEKKAPATVTIDGKTSRYDAQALSGALEGLEELE